MKKILSILLFLCISGSLYAQDLSPVVQVPGYVPYVPYVQYAQYPFRYNIVYPPQTIYQPYQFQGSTIKYNYYPDRPLKNLLFGGWRVDNFYAPVDNR